MDQVGGGTEIAGKLRVFLDGCKSGSRTDISVLADQSIDRCILAECFYSRSENDEFGAVGKRHASPVDCFIAQPGTLEFFRIQVDHRLSNARVKHEEVGFETELRGFLKTLGVITDEESSGGQSPVFTSPHDGQDVYNRQVLDEMARGIVQDSAHRIVGPPHDAFHAVDSAQKMAAVDTVRPAGADKNVLVV